MPLRLPDKLPAIELLKAENIFVMNATRAHSQDIRPLEIVILNLMPLKITTETDLVRILSNSPLQLNITFMKLLSHTPKNTPVEHMKQFYLDFAKLRDRRFDAMIITGAPLEMMAYEEVSYWPEIVDIFAWSQTHVTSTLTICWAAQAALYFRYGIQKYPLPTKTFGIFPQTMLQPYDSIFRGFDDVFMMPHSRHTYLRDEDICAVPDLVPLATGPDTGISAMMTRDGRAFFVIGHLEYAVDTLHKEYHRDLGKRDDVAMPRNYYPGDDPTVAPIATWRSAGYLFFHNWINYYVYQTTPYDLSAIH